MDAKVWAICGLAAGFLMCIAAFAGSLDLARARMAAAGKAPICGPAGQAKLAKGSASPAPSTQRASGL